MAGFVDVLLRGLLVALVSLALGGVAWVRLVLRTRPGTAPGGGTALALRVVAWAGGLAAAVQATVVGGVLVDLASRTGAWPLAELGDTAFARAGAARIGLAAAAGILAWRLAHRPGGQAAWAGLAGATLGLAAMSAALSHALAALERRPLLLALDAVHQVAAAVWVGGLAHLVLFAARVDRGKAQGWPAAVRRFSNLALGCVVALVVAGTGLSALYVGDPAALLGTAYGIMVLTKVVLLAGILGLAAVARRCVVRAVEPAPRLRLARLVEVELGLGLTALYAAAALTSLPPAVDVGADRASLAEVAARLAPGMPRLTSPAVDDLLRTADPLMVASERRTAVERAWSEYNHHWAGLVVLLMGLLASAEGLGVRAARHWPLGFLGLAAFLATRADPRAWPLGPAGFWESMTLPDVLQHRFFIVLVAAFGVFEWAVRTGRLGPRPWAHVFPLLCAAGGGLLLSHSHAMFAVKEEFLTELTHAPLGVLGVATGWARWLELRLPGASGAAGWTWRACLVAVGALLACYREG